MKSLCIRDSPCHEDANCIDEEGDISCTCKDGYEGDGVGNNGCTSQGLSKGAIAGIAVGVILVVVIVILIVVFVVLKSKKKKGVTEVEMTPS